MVIRFIFQLPEVNVVLRRMNQWMITFKAQFDVANSFEVTAQIRVFKLGLTDEIGIRQLGNDGVIGKGSI